MKYTLIVVIVAVLLGLAYGATPITTLPYSNSGDTTNSGFFTPPCDVTKQGDLYSFTGTGDFVTVATCPEDGGDANYDSEIYVWVDGAADECIAVADDNCGSQSKATFLGESGVNYIIFVSGYSDNVGTYTVAVASAGSAATPVPITSLPFTNSGDTSTSGYSLTTCDGIKQGDVFSITGSGGYLFASTCSDDGGAASYDTKIIVVDSNGNCVAENDDFCDLQSFTSFFAISGQTYNIIITGYGAETGTYTLVVGNGEPVNAVPVTSLPFVVSGNTEQSAELSSPCSFGQNQGDLFSLIGDGSVYYATTCAELGGEANFDTVLNVWTPGAIDCTTSNDDACGLQSYVSWTTEAGVEYWIQVQGFGGSTGDYTIVIDKGDPGAPTTGTASSSASASISSSGASIGSASASISSSGTGELNKRSLAEKAFKSQVASASTTTTGLVLVALVCAALMM